MSLFHSTKSEIPYIDVAPVHLKSDGVPGGGLEIPVRAVNPPADLPLMKIRDGSMRFNFERCCIVRMHSRISKTPH